MNVNQRLLGMGWATSLFVSVAGLLAMPAMLRAQCNFGYCTEEWIPEGLCGEGGCMGWVESDGGVWEPSCPGEVCERWYCQFRYDDPEPWICQTGYECGGQYHWKCFGS